VRACQSWLKTDVLARWVYGLGRDTCGRAGLWPPLTVYIHSTSVVKRRPYYGARMQKAPTVVEASISSEHSRPSLGAD